MGPRPPGSIIRLQVGIGEHRIAFRSQTHYYQEDNPKTDFNDRGVLSAALLLLIDSQDRQIYFLSPLPAGGT